MDYSPPGSSVHGILQARIWSGLLFPSPGGLPDPGIEPMSSALAGGFFAIEPPGMNSKMGSQHLLTTDTLYSVHVLIGHLLKANTKHQSYTDTGVNKEPGLMLQIVYIS